jgi:hypothetical protein
LLRLVEVVEAVEVVEVVEVMVEVHKEVYIKVWEWKIFLPHHHLGISLFHVKSGLLCPIKYNGCKTGQRTRQSPSNN